MEQKFEIGQIVYASDRYLSEGFERYGRNLKQINGLKITNACLINHIDHYNNLVCHWLYTLSDGRQFAEFFLSAINCKKGE